MYKGALLRGVKVMDNEINNQKGSTEEENEINDTGDLNSTQENILIEK